MAFLINGQPLTIDTPFTDADGNHYPATWLRLSSLEEKLAIGIKEVPDPQPYDQRFYWGYDQANKLIPKEHSMLVQLWTKQTKDTVNSILSSSDWMVIRQADNGKEMTQEWKEWREEVRAASKEKCAAIAATETTDELVQFLIGPTYSEWPLNPEEKAKISA